MSIHTELSRIQQALNAPKDQWNDFGKYKYRSCEGILEALKPLLGSCSLIITDEIVEMGGGVYIKATASLTDDGEKFIQGVAYAREPEQKKGMDSAMISGSTSSFSRKYALNGLFLIDDNKDNDYPQGPPPNAKTQDPPPVFKPAPQMPELKAFHALGRKTHGDKWQGQCLRIVQDVTGSARGQWISDSNLMNPTELATAMTILKGESK